MVSFHLGQVDCPVPWEPVTLMGFRCSEVFIPLAFFRVNCPGYLRWTKVSLRISRAQHQEPFLPVLFLEDLRECSLDPLPIMEHTPVFHTLQFPISILLLPRQGSSRRIPFGFPIWEISFQNSEILELLTSRMIEWKVKGRYPRRSM